MNIGIRFSSPIPEETDIKSFAKLFDDNEKEKEEVLDNAPYEVSVLACLLNRLGKLILK